MKRKDYYFRKAKKENLRARSAFKLMEINNKYKIIKINDKVLDLGAWPGSWMQVASKIVKDDGYVLGVDTRKIEKIGENTKTLQLDITDKYIIDEIKAKITKADVVLSDLAPNTSGNREIDQYKSYELSNKAFRIAVKILKPHGNFICKVFDSDSADELIKVVKKKFVNVRVSVPRATRKGSKEIYIIAINRKG